MRICFWTPSVFSLGGTKRVVTLIANELSKQHDVTIMTQENRIKENRLLYQLDSAVKIDFLNIFDFEDGYHFSLSAFRNKAIKKINHKTGAYNDPKKNKVLAEAIFSEAGRKKLAEYINEQKYDVVIATGRLALWLAMMTPYLKCKTVGWQHSCYDAYINETNAIFLHQENLLKNYLPKLNAYIVLTPYDQRDYKKNLGIETKVMVNPRSFTSKEKTNPLQKHFLMVTRFEYAKGVDLMLDAFEEYCKLDPEWDLTILGDGALFKTTLQDAKDRKLTDRIHFLGRTNHVPDYYLTSSVLLLPSRWEGWPMVVMEAYEFGLPVIAFKTAALDLIIQEGETGLLVEAYDTKKFAEAMLKLAKDPEERERLAANAIRESSKYDISTIGQKWEEFLFSL